MQFKRRNLRAIAEMAVGNAKFFTYRSSFYITQFFEECELDFTHDGSSRVPWAEDVLKTLLDDPQPGTNQLPERFGVVLRTLMDKREAADQDDINRSNALAALNVPLMREGFEGYFAEDGLFYVRHVESRAVSVPVNIYRPHTPAEIDKRELLITYLDGCSEDELIEEVLLPMFRHLGYQRITSVGHRDKALEYGKDVWMRYKLPTEHVIYFGIQAKKGKLDSAGVTKSSNANIAEIHNQVLMMLGHEVWDSDTNKTALVDHAFIVAGGDITKAARNWLGNVLDKSRRSQIMFMDREHILNLYIGHRLDLPNAAKPKFIDPWSIDEDIPF
jgi:hypothetical protein